MGIDLDLWRARIGLFNASRVPRLRSRVNLVNISVDTSLLTALCGAVLTVFVPYFLLTHILCASQLPHVASIHAVYTLHPLYVLSSFASLVPVLRLMSCLLVTVGVLTVSHSFGRTISISIPGYKISQKLIIILLLSYCLAHLLILAGDVETNPGPERGAGGEHLSSIFHALKYGTSAPLRMLPLLVAGVPGAGITTLMKHLFPKITFTRKSHTAHSVQAVLSEKGCFELDEAVMVLHQVLDGVKAKKALKVLKEVELVSSKHLALAEHAHQSILPPGFKGPMDFFKDVRSSDVEGYFADRWCTVYLTDMGGQHNFEAIIPAFVTMPSVFLLVVNLNEDLACKHGSAATHFGLTTQEVIMQSLASIDCVIQSLPHGVNPKVLLVGTHMDLISKQQVTSVDDLLQALIRNTEVESLVHFASPTQMMFPVSSLTPDDPGIQHLQAVINHFALDSDEFQATVLLKWLIFNALIQQTNKPVWTYKQCFQVAAHCGISTYSEFDDALQFLHTRVGVLRYFPMIKEHRNIVIIKPDYLVEVLSNLITANFTEKKEDQIALKQFKKTGLLAMEFYQTASKHSNELLTASKLLALLEYHHTAVQYDHTSAKFFIPCVLSSSPHDRSALFHSSDIAPLLIHFDCGYCPVGLFSLLVVHLTENKPGSKLQWNLITEAMFQDQISLHVEPCHCTVRLTKFLAYYSVELISTDVTACKMSLGELCLEVRQYIENGLKVSTKLVKLTKYSFELALVCPDPESKLHPHPSIIRFHQDQPHHVECVKTRKSWEIPSKSTIWFEYQEKDRPTVVTYSQVAVTQLLPQGVSVLKPPVEKPALQELAVIPLKESQWYTLGQSLGLKEGLLKSIQHGTSNPIKCKREMFKIWLKEKVSWQVLLRALRKIGATDVAEVVRSEYGISDSSDSEEVSGGEDEVDAGFSEDVDITKPKRGSTSHSEKHCELPKTPEYMAFEACYHQLMSLVSEQVNDCARRAFSRALIDTSKLDKIRSSLVTDEAKATELLREIGQMIRTSVPQAFERFLLILTTDQETPVVQRLTSLANLYKVLIEFQKLSTSEINLDALAKEFFNKGLIAPSSYEECIQTDESLPKATILYEQLSKLRASHPFMKLLAAYPNTKDVAEALKRKSGTSTPSSEPSQDSSGYFTGRTEDLESSLGSTSSGENQRPTEDTKPWESEFSSGYQTGQMEELDSRIESRKDRTLTEDANLDASMYRSLESSTSSDQFHSLDSQNGTMVLGTLKERLSESTLPSLERLSSNVTSFTDTSTPKEKSAVYPFQFQAEAQTLFDDPAEKFLMAIERNDPASIDSLLRRQEVNIDQVLKDGRTGLHVAAASAYHDVVKVLLYHKCTVDARDHDGITPLYLTTYYGNYEVMKMLVVAFADVNAVTKDGTPVLLHPASKGYSMVTEYLLENGANPNLADKLGVTPLIAATRKGQRDVVAVLLQHGADVSSVSLETSRTALQEAVYREYTEIVTMLIKAQSAADERSRALFTCKTAEMLRKLVKGGARVDDRRGDGATPLIVHTEQGNFEVVKMLVEFNANVDLQDEAGFSALMKAAKSGNLEILQVLINAEAILDLKSKQGLTALMYAVQNRSEQAAKKLLLAGADGNARDKGRKTVVEMAEERGCVETVRLLKRQMAVSNTSDPFVHLLSSYLGKDEGSNRSSEPSSTSRGSSPVISRKHTQQHAAARPRSEMSLVPMSHHVVPKPRSSDIEDNTMRDQLSKAWKRIADLETRIHDLTLQATMEPPPESDLTYLDRSRLEEEYRKLKELKKKAEYYAVEAKQTAQRLSAENFKLKEDLSRERHHNELTRKNMIREMEQKMDKSATALDRADARLEVFEQEVNERALQMIRRMSTPTALALQLPGTTTQLEPSFVKDLILKHKIRASFVVVGIAGLPYSGKSTLLSHILEMQHSQEEHARITLPGGLSMFEAVMMKDKINEECRWINSTRLDAEVLAIAVALAHVCAKSQQNPSFFDFTATKPGAFLFKDSKVDECFQKSFERLTKMMKWVQQQGKMDKLMTSSLTFVNIFDVGVNKAVFEVLGIVTNQFKNLLLVNVLSLKDAQGDGLHRSPNLKDKDRYRERGDSEMTMKLHSCLKYYTEIIAATPRAPQSTVLVGTFADKLTETELQATRTQVLHSVNGRAEAVGIMEAICPGMFTIDARNNEQALEVRAALEGMIEKRNFEIDIKLSWIFFRGVLFQTKKLFMSKSEMLVLAKKCGLQGEEELEEFLKLFFISGSIVYSPSNAFPVLQQHIILDPIAFISGLDKLYYIHTNHSIPDNLKEDLESTKNGFLSRALAKHLWDEHDFYLQVLETLGLIVQVNEVLKKSSKVFFMPSLRVKHDATMPDADSNSLIITHNLDALPYFKLSSFVLALTNLYKDQIEFETDVHYNVIRFKWHTPAAKCYVRFRGEFVDIGVKIAENCSQLQHATLCSIIKTACIEIFNRMVQDLHGLKYNLAIVCPESKHPDKRLHFIPFHATQYDCNHLFCPKCQCHIEEAGIPPVRKLWIRAAYQGVPGEIFYPEDFLSNAEIGEVVDRLSQQPFERVQCLAYKLGFTKGEFTEKSQGRSIKDLVFFLLLEWKRRSPTSTKQSLALLLMSCGHYTEALRLDPTLPASARPLTPDTLTTKELAFVAQSVARNWVELARTLGLQETDIQEIQKTYRTHGEQSFQMLERWLHLYSSQQTLPASISLIKALKSIKYHHLADFIETESQQEVLK